jgi:tetratricopeptide (TPR) repeat protein
VAKFHFFQTSKERLNLGAQGSYPVNLIEVTKDKTEIKHPVNDTLTRPWLRHYFLTQIVRDSNNGDDAINRDHNLIEIFKTTIPLQENSFTESLLSSWRLFLDSAFKVADTPWYDSIKNILHTERFYAAIEQLELEPPASNPQLKLHFYDHTKTLRRFPRIPIKLFFSLPGNEKEALIEILRVAINNNPHNLDIAFLTYCFLRAWNRPSDFLEIARTENRYDLEEWYFWVESDLQSVGAIKRNMKDFSTAFFVYERAYLPANDCKELADWFLKESEFKAAYHFYTKAKEFEIALELLQNISVKEFGELANLRRISRGEKIFDTSGDTSRFAIMYQEETETLRGFARIRAAETYKQVATKARHHFDRETIETKYAFGELTEDEYSRLIHQLQERKQ